ncbi:MAG: DJ-1/PfpI family protein [Nanobdellota archaeon]
MKRVLFFIAENGFRDEEFFETKQVLEDGGYECDSVSTSNVECHGSQGMVIMPTQDIDQLDVDDYNAIVLVGGPGALEMGEDTRIQMAIKEAYDKKKIVNAICIAPLILAKLGFLKGRKATIFSGGVDKLKKFDLLYTDEDVVVDKSEEPVIITANGPGAAQSFGEKIKQLLDNY